MQRKKIRKSSIIGQKGVNLIEKIVLDMGFLWHPTGAFDAGIDGTIEIRDPATGEVTNLIIQVQSKATEKSFQAETPAAFDFVCEAKDLDYWLQGNAPVVLVVSRPDSNEAYWVSVKDYFKDEAIRRSRTVHFDKRKDRFDEASRDTLIRLAMPQDAGIYFSPLPKQEQLYSNLLEVSYFPEHLYIAETSYRHYGALWSKLSEFREGGARAGGEWILKYGSIMSFLDLDQYPWSEVCDVGTLEVFDTEEWAFADDDEKRWDFVQLLNRCLQEKAWTLHLKYHRDLELYFVRPTEDLSPRHFRYRSLEKETSRELFGPRKRQGDSGKTAYYRHSAFTGMFQRYDDAWYLEITPTYYFTFDGYEEDKYREDRLKRIKEFERHAAVFGQVIMWARYLGRPGDMFHREYPLLKFGELKKFDVGFGIDDESWRRYEAASAELEGGKRQLRFQWEGDE